MSQKVYPGPTDEDVPPQAGALGVDAAVSFSAGDQTYGEESTEPADIELQYDRALDGLDMTSFSTMDFSTGGVYWPTRDENSPEYAHLTDIAAQTAFEVTAQDVEMLISANRFQPEGQNNIIVLGIRGSVLQSGFEAENLEAIPLLDVRPNHVDFRCTLGFYFRNEKRLTLFAGSTVPCTYYIQNYYNRIHGLPHTSTTRCNLMPSGCYVSRVGTHSGGTINPAVRTTAPADLSKDAKVTVLRTRNDMAFGTQDVWDPTTPFDNIHCSYFLHHSPKYGARFSSAGCSTVRGRKDPSDQWAKFQAVLNSLGQGKRVDYMLLTGREYAIAAQLRRDGRAGDRHLVQRELGRLRVGSQGEEVVRLQRLLGFQGTGYFGFSTKKRLTEYQKEEGLRSDGVYSPLMDERLGWGVFQ